MDSLMERLELIAAWHIPGGQTPKQKCPAIHTNVREAAARIAALEAEVARLKVIADPAGIAIASLVAGVW